MMIMVMMTMMIYCFCGMINRRKAFSFISSQDSCQRSSPSWISDTPRTGFKPGQNLGSGCIEWSCALVITTILLLCLAFSFQCWGGWYQGSLKNLRLKFPWLKLKKKFKKVYFANSYNETLIFYSLHWIMVKCFKFTVNRHLSS